MIEDETDRDLKARQDAALSLHPNPGAVIRHTNLNRKQEIVAVTRDDLEDIRSFDGFQTMFFGFGMFLVSGAGWLLVENLLTQTEFKIDAIVAVCAVCVLFGLFSLVVGYLMGARKRGKITRIFEQTKPMK